jgi:hypothetical protein
MTTYSWEADVNGFRRKIFLLLASFVSVLSSLPALAQVTPAAGFTPPDDTPTIRLGVTLFPQYVLQTEPNITDAAGNSVNRSGFDVGRAYINITGNLHHLISYRLTPDITRESGLLALAPGNLVANDSLVFRIKYAYGQFNLDEWTTPGTWVRFGIQQTPWVDFEEGIYRYRFQGTVFAERVPLPTAMSSSDAGVSLHYNFPKSYGDFHIGIYNGENYQRTEVNDQKGIEMRGTLRPLPGGAPVLRGLRVHGVYYDDSYVSDAERRRAMGNVTWLPGSTTSTPRISHCPRPPSCRATGIPSGSRLACRSRTAHRGKHCSATITGLPTLTRPRRRPPPPRYPARRC